MTDNTTGKTTTYCYTNTNRLASAITAGGDSFSYTYDADGNRTQTTKNGVVVDTQTVNAADQLTNTGYSYDASGNLATSTALGTVTYSKTEQMTQRVEGGKTSTYTYAGTNQNELLSVTTPNTGARAYTYGRDDANGLPLIEAYKVGADQNYIAHDPGGTPIAIRAASGNIQYYVEDGLGSTTNLINRQGQESAEYTYDPSGGVTVTAPTSTATAERVNPFRYAGGTYDVSSNLIKFGQRWYDPDTGRFTQQDSLETLADPTRANRYEYAAGNPINYIDPTGKVEFGVEGCVGFVIAVCGGVSYSTSGGFGGSVGAGVGLGTDVSFTASPNRDNGPYITAGGCGGAVCGEAGFVGGEPTASAGFGAGVGGFITGGYQFSTGFGAL